MSQMASTTLRRALIFGLIAAGSLAVSLALDAGVARFMASRTFNYSYDLYTLFRLAGFLPLWMVVAVAFVLLDSARGWPAAISRGGLLLLAVAIAGLAAEILKLIVRRERPGLDVTMYVFRPWHQDAFSTSGLGSPSGHTTVAFAAVWTLCRLHPRATPLWLAIGGACAFSRLANNAHFISDVVSGALIGYAVVALLWPIFRGLQKTLSVSR